ncbi:MAG: ELWxxDGT repeat protein [Planctomycetota bacterium]
MYKARPLAACLAVAVFGAAPTPAQSPVLVKDINASGPPESSSDPHNFVQVGADVFFVGRRPDVGTEVFKTRSQPGTVELLADISAGRGGSSPVGLTEVGGRLLFIADRPVGFGAERSAYLSDGTEAGTIRLATEYPYSRAQVVGSGPCAYFTMTEFGVWKTDGTSAGTSRFRSSRATHLMAFGGGVLFADGSQLVLSDGTAAGTVELAAFRDAPVPFAVAGGCAYVRGRDAATGALGLWKTDGTAAGTVAVLAPFADIETDARRVGVLAGELYFVAGDAPRQFGRELWKTDGTAAGTQLVQDIASGPEASAPIDLTPLAGALLFAADPDGQGYELWRTTGTAASRVAPGVGVGIDVTRGRAVEAAGTLAYFAGCSAASGCELWQTDGTAAGTKRFVEIVPGLRGSDPHDLTVLGGTLYFAANAGEPLVEPFVSDGTAAGTQLLANLGFRSISSDPSELTEFYGVTLFAADDGRTGRELWRTDGTTTGTQRVRDLVPGRIGSNPRGLVVVGDRVLFSADDATGTPGLWCTDGTAAGTTLVRPIDFLHGRGTAVTGDTVFLVANDGASGNELWRSDGTTAGTTLVADLTPGAVGSSLRLLDAVAGRAFFRFDPLVTRSELWVTDGTALGTQPLAETVAWAPHAALAGKLLFTGTNPASGTELWETNGTPAGTRPVVDLLPGPGGSFPDQFAVAGDTLFFQAKGSQLWRSDGTAAGTVAIVDLTGSPGTRGPVDLQPFGDGIVFKMILGVDHQLWRSDGTTEGTVQVRNRYFGISGLSTFGHRHVFFAGDEAMGGSGYTYAYEGDELWASDATAAGTRIVADLAIGSASSTPRAMLLSRGRVLFSADDNLLGRELWSVDPGATAQPVGAACGGGAPPQLATDDPVLGGIVTVTTRAPPTSAGAVLLGLPVPAQPLGSGCFLYLAPATSTVLAPVPAGPSRRSFAIPLPQAVALAGVRVSLQAVLAPSTAPLGADLSNAVWWTLGR